LQKKRLFPVLTRKKSFFADGLKRALFSARADNIEYLNCNNDIFNKTLPLFLKRVSAFVQDYGGQGGNPHLRHLPEGQGGVIPEPTIGFPPSYKTTADKGGNPHLRHLPEGQGGVIPKPTIGFSCEKKFSPSPEITYPYREQSLS
jgi:hypothetical protein